MAEIIFLKLAILILIVAFLAALVRGFALRNEPNFVERRKTHRGGVHEMTPKECRDDVISEGHELYDLLKADMKNGATFGERQEDGSIKITSVKQKKGK